MELTSPPNARVGVSIPSGADRVVEFHLDGWRLMLVDLDQSSVRVNDLRATHAFSHGARLPEPIYEPAVDIGPGADGTSILVVVGTILGVISPLADRPSHVEVQVIHMDADSGSPTQLLVDCEVRYRQLPQRRLDEVLGDAAGGE